MGSRSQHISIGIKRPMSAVLGSSATATSAKWSSLSANVPMTDEAFARDADAVGKDLATLKSTVEAP